MADEIYTDGFYAAQVGGSQASAASMVPFLVENLQPSTMIDIGCGSGVWVREFASHGVSGHGVDGPWVEKSALVISPEEFTPYDFNVSASPFQISLPRQKFDLLISMEFLEHLEPVKADPIVDFMTSIADVIVAGAAIPGQGGHCHLNEQYPSYWIERFAAHGYEAFDLVRPIFWSDPRVEYWYAQNTLAYFRGGVPASVRNAASDRMASMLSHPADLVHPQLLQAYRNSRSAKAIRSIRKLIGQS